MALQIVQAATFPQLTRSLMEQLARDGLHDPWVPKWVLTPTRTAATQLRLRLGEASRRRPQTGIRVVPLTLFVERLEQAAFSRRGRRWNLLLDFLLLQFVQKLPDDSRLGALKGIPGGYLQLKPTLLDLADGGFGPEAVELLAELAADGDLPEIDRETLDFYCRWLQAIGDSDWQPLRLQALGDWLETAEAATLARIADCEPGALPHLHLFGFYDFTDVNARVIAGLCRHLDATLYFPCPPGKTPHPAFHFAEEVLSDLQVRLGTLASTDVDAPPLDGPTDAAARFFLQTFPEGKVPDQPPFLSVQSVSSCRSEALSAAVHIRQWLDADATLDPSDILVVAPEITTYFEALRDVFAAFALPLRVADLPRNQIDRPPSQQILRRLWSEQVPTDWLLTYLREHGPLPVLESIDLDHFETELRKLSLSGGNAWSSLRKILEAGAQENATVETRFTPAEIDLVSSICRTWLDWNQADFSAGEATLFLNGLRPWVAQTGTMDPLLAEVEEIGQLFPGARIPAEILLDHLTLEESPPYSDPADAPGVLALSLMRARGITARGIVFMGLSSTLFPARVQEDPLLGDPTRHSLARSARTLGHRVPIKTLATREMELLFVLINTSAERIHWVIPETDDEGRSVSPTPWVLRYIHHWGETATAPAGRIPRSPREQAQYLLTLDPCRGSQLPPEYGQLLERGLAALRYGRSLFDHVSIAARYRAELPDWDSRIPGGKLVDPESFGRISVTQFGTLAQCPYRFYAGRVAGLVALQPGEFSEELDPLTWGSSLHTLLESLLLRNLDGKTPIGEVAERLLADHSSALRAAVSGLPEPVLNRLRLLPPPLTRAYQERLFRTTESYFQSVREAPDADWVPMLLEAPLRAQIPDLGGVAISGQADRIDRLGPNRYRIIDYKSGKIPAGRKLLDADSVPFRLGFFPQAVLYPYLFRLVRETSETPGFCYQYLKDSPTKVKEIEGSHLADQLFAGCLELLQNGCFPASSNELFRLLGLPKETQPCEYCEFHSLCRRDEAGSARGALQQFQALAPLRFSQFVALRPEESEA